MDPLDELDQAMLDTRLAKLSEDTNIHVGDYIRHVDGTLRQVAHLWDDGTLVQTCDGGSFFLGHGNVSMSGCLYHGVPPDTLTPTGETKPTRMWFFHHDSPERDSRVEFDVAVRVWKCSVPADDL